MPHYVTEWRGCIAAAGNVPEVHGMTTLLHSIIIFWCNINYDISKLARSFISWLERNGKRGISYLGIIEGNHCVADETLNGSGTHLLLSIIVQLAFAFICIPLIITAYGHPL
jgi:hypothetical protein